jgi:hypothetical protein
MSAFTTILVNGLKAGQVPAREKKARDWYRKAAKNHGAITVNQNFLQEDKDRLRNAVIPGNMYMFWYNPKHAKTLPYYDRFPLIFPFAAKRDRFWGLNLHYLPLNYRAVLMDRLYDLTSNTRYDETTKLKLSYELLNSTTKFNYFKPCVKQYLTSHMASKFLYIYPSEWDTALFLPTEQFQKGTKTQVWKDSKQAIRGKN